MKRILVSGIGRSGTTLVYQQIAKLLLVEGLNTNFRYEPYLWNIQSPQAAGNPFSMEQINHFGVHVHTSTPLFQAAPLALHDEFLDRLFAGVSDRDPAVLPEACLAKVIRGSGRLRCYMDRFPDLKLVACLRNPYDTINSSLGMFSFFGEEFHASDRPRFKAELAASGWPVEELPDQCHSVEWSAAWFAAFTAETLAVAQDYPGRVHLFCLERYQSQPGEMLARLQDFLGIHNDGILMGLSAAAGVKIKATSLTAHDIAVIGPVFARYRDQVLMAELGAEQASQIESRLLRRYGGADFSLPIAGSDAGRKNPMQLRNLLVNNQRTPFIRLLQSERSPVPLDALIGQYGGEAQSGDIRMPQPLTLKKGRTFGVVITNYNGGALIVDAILSCLNQTLPYDQIVVVDDRSTDTSLEMIRLLADLYSCITVVALPANLGPSAARHIGISRLTTDFVTQLDGDDLFWPTKNAGEAQVLAGDLDSVAFSDILWVLPEDRSVLRQTDAYHLPGAGPGEVFGRLMARASHIPRDMTFARHRYFEAGGYDLAADLYEDWDFKLRLAALPDLRWQRSASVAGTLYNRISPSLSGKTARLHARALTTIFLKALRHGLLRDDQIIPAFAAALDPYKDGGLVRSVQQWLAAQIGTGNFDAMATADFFGSRRVHAMSLGAFEAFFAQLATQDAPLPPLQPQRPDNPWQWEPRAGFSRQPQDQAGIGSLFSPPLFAQTGADGYLQVRLHDAAPGFALQLHFPQGEQHLLVEVAGRRHEQTITAPQPGSAVHVPVPLALARGRSLIRISAHPANALDAASTMLLGDFYIPQIAP